MRVVEFSIERRAVLLGVCPACGPHLVSLKDPGRPAGASWYRWCHRCHAFFRPVPDRVSA